MRRVWALYVYSQGLKSGVLEREKISSNLLFIILHLRFRNQKEKLALVQQRLREYQLQPSSTDFQTVVSLVRGDVPDIANEFMEEKVYIDKYLQTLK